VRFVPIVVGERSVLFVVAGRGAGAGAWGLWVRVEHAFPATEPIPPTRQMTMKMGLERGLLETIPEILAVEQVSATGEALCDDTVMEVLDEIRPFLKNMGGDIELIRVDATDLQPSCTLRLTGPSAALRSIKGEIIQARPHDPAPHPAPPRPAPPRPIHPPVAHTATHTSIHPPCETRIIPPPPAPAPAPRTAALHPCVHRRACTLTHASFSPQRLRAKMPTLDGVLWEE
jgi:Fe-S cluster biogenesis protein NfuA